MKDYFLLGITNGTFLRHQLRSLNKPIFKMNTINPNDPAFPLIGNAPHFENGYNGFRPGLSIRAEIASRCMAGILSHSSVFYGDDPINAAAKAVICADALIAELNKPPHDQDTLF